MEISKKIKDKILYDNDFSLKGAGIMGITQASFRNLVRRNSTKLTLYSLVKFYKSEGYTEDEIFELETTNKQCKPPQKY